MESSREDNCIYQLREMLGKFPRGLNVSAHDLASVGWLYFYEKETGQRDIAERELCLQLERAVSILGLEGAISARAGLDRLLQYRLLRQSISDVSSHRYCLTRLARRPGRRHPGGDQPGKRRTLHPHQPHFRLPQSRIGKR